MKKQHPQYERITEMIEQGRSDHRISDLLRVNRKYIANVRAELGADPYSRTRSVAAQLAAYSSTPDPNGHVWWTGSVSTSGSPRIRIGGKEVPAMHSVFELRTGRPAVGQVRADCGLKHCVAPSHIMDDVERRRVRLQTRALLGYPDHWQTCPACEASWDEEGRVEEKLSLYCRRCTTQRKIRNRKEPTS
jgi:hypothetical protein